ncbi:MAG: hypothetical protein IJK23_05720 [Clostridia bacterium]|nr:hypothetical protein [Clostridia bacterium]
MKKLFSITGKKQEKHMQHSNNNTPSSLKQEPIKMDLSKTYIKNQNGTITKADGNVITDEEIPYLIQMQDTAESRNNNSNPVFHRSSREEDLAFDFSERYSGEIAKYISYFEKPFDDSRHAESDQEEIDLLNTALTNFQTSRKWFYSKGKGGQIYFDDLFIHLQNSQNNDYSYEDIIRERIVYIEKAVRCRKDIIDIIASNDNVLQKDIYRFFAPDEKSLVLSLIRDLERETAIIRTKKGSTYLLSLNTENEEKNPIQYTL